MRILLTSGHLENFSGSKQWVYTVAKEFSKEHTVTVVSPRNGVMADKIAELGIAVAGTKEIVTVTEGSESSNSAVVGLFDLGIISQVQSAPIVRSGVCKKTIFISHGLGQADKPLQACDVIVGLSSEINAKWGIQHLLPNPIDTEWYFQPKKVLYISEHGGLLDLLIEICTELGYELKHARKTWHVREAIQWSDIVVSVGRGCLEAMSCGKEVIIADYRKYNGKPLMDTSYNLSHNNSGRCDKCEPTKDILRERLLGNRSIILQIHDVRVICQKLLALAESVTKVK